MVFRVMYNVCAQLKLAKVSKVSRLLIANMTFRVAHWDTLVDSVAF